MPKPVIFLLSALLILAICCGCTKQRGYEIGDPEQAYQIASPNNILANYFNFFDTIVKSELTFLAERKPSMKEDYLLLETKSELGIIWVLANKDKYENICRKLDKGEIFTVIGRVSAVAKEGDADSQIAIIVP